MTSKPIKAGDKSFSMEVDESEVKESSRRDRVISDGEMLDMLNGAIEAFKTGVGITWRK